MLKGGLEIFGVSAPRNSGSIESQWHNETKDKKKRKYNNPAPKPEIPVFQ
jgi:hypothetical protein